MFNSCKLWANGMVVLSQSRITEVFIFTAYGDAGTWVLWETCGDRKCIWCFFYRSLWIKDPGGGLLYIMAQMWEQCCLWALG